MRNKRLFLIFLIIFVIGNIFGLGFINGFEEQHLLNQRLEIIKLCKQKEDTKQLLYDEVNDYIKKVAPNSKLNGKHLVDKCIEYDFDICFALGQGHIESHFGTTGKAKYTNSVWNVGSHKNHSYETPDDAVEPYIKLIKNKYVKNGKTEIDLLHNFTTKSGKRFAESDTYEHNLKTHVNKIKNSTIIDSLTNEIKQYDILIRKEFISYNKQ